MKRVLIGLIAAAALPALAVAQTEDKAHPPEKAMDSATPEMKNPEGTDKMHPPQKAMDKATPTEKNPASTGESSGETGQSKTYNAQDDKSGAEQAPKK